jgi:protein involved in polysaccharide export with SLBB domain
MKTFLWLKLAFVLLAGVWAASAQMPVPMLPMNRPATATPTTPAAVPGLLNGFVPDDTYTLRVGDTISFRILEDRIWNAQNAPQSLVVVDSGEMDVPYIGRMQAVGKTSKQLAAEIKTALEKDYYQQATVFLSLNIASPILGRVYIWGQVHNQGALDIAVNENLTAGKAILRAGGFADFANKRKVKVVRSAPDAKGKSQTFELDMQQILEDGKVDKDVVLQPNDLIIVPSRLVNF